MTRVQAQGTQRTRGAHGAPATFRETLAAAATRMREAGVPGAARDARLLLACAAKIDPSRVSVMAPEPVDRQVRGRFDAFVDRRCAREPVSRIVGFRDFAGRNFRISGAVLDPRPETETLVEAALAEPFARLLDLGTGSGCILVTLLAETDGPTGVGVDISGDACVVARENAEEHGVADRATFVQSDWSRDVEGRFDLVVANPPYVAKGELESLAPEVRLHDPEIALTDGGDGLGAHGRIAAALPDLLDPGGRALVEIAPAQADAVSDLFREAGLERVAVVPDFDGRPRVVAGRAPRPGE